MKRIERIPCGNGNCYLIDQDGKAVLVDTARSKYRIKLMNICKKTNVVLIVLTHGHVDHIQNTAYIANQLNIPIAMHRADYELTKNNTLEPLLAHSILGKLVLALSRKSIEHDEIEAFEPCAFLQEGDHLVDYGINATVVGLPGHTKGSIGLNVWGTDFIVGDALMNIFYLARSM